LIRRALRGLLAVVDRATDVAAAIAMLMIVLMIGTVLYEIVSRQVFRAPTIWAFDVSYMLNGSLFLLGAAYTLRKGGHVRVDFIFEKLPEVLRHAIQLVLYLALLVPVLWLGTNVAISRAHRAWVRGTLENASAWEPVLWPFLTALALGLTLLLAQVVVEAVRSAMAIIDGLRRRPAP
jgi:TRAP-type mannitol/chloroaromatic compound transport system permease small subunit